MQAMMLVMMAPVTESIFLRLGIRLIAVGACVSIRCCSDGGWRLGNNAKCTPSSLLPVALLEILTRFGLALDKIQSFPCPCSCVAQARSADGKIWPFGASGAEGTYPPSRSWILPLCRPSTFSTKGSLFAPGRLTLPG